VPPLQRYWLSASLRQVKPVGQELPGFISTFTGGIGRLGCHFAGIPNVIYEEYRKKTLTQPRM
jgi:hypothetical protein